jgi:hypothetical protein
MAEQAFDLIYYFMLIVDKNEIGAFLELDDDNLDFVQFLFEKFPTIRDEFDTIDSALDFIEILLERTFGLENHETVLEKIREDNKIKHLLEEIISNETISSNKDKDKYDGSLLTKISIIEEKYKIFNIQHK